MIAGEAIKTDFQPLTADSPVDRVAQRMDELEVTAMPVVDSTTGKLIGQVGRSHLDTTDPDLQTIADIELQEPVKVYENQHLFEVMRLMLQYELRLISIIEDDMTFKGVILKKQVLESLTRLLNLAVYGSVIIIKLEQRDFTLSEIIQLIEHEEAKILGITVETPDEDQDIFKVSIKINLKDPSRVASSLRRYGYTVTTGSKSEVYGFDFESRADELINYLDI